MPFERGIDYLLTLTYRYIGIVLGGFPAILCKIIYVLPVGGIAGVPPERGPISLPGKPWRW